MSVIYYDTALKEKLKEVFNNTFFATTEEAFKECARVNNGKVKLPLISVFRPMGFTINTSRYNEHEFRTGYFIKKVKEPPKAEMRVLKALPVRLQYQVDVWTVTKASCDRLTEELIMWLQYDPYIRFVNPVVELMKYDEVEGEVEKTIEAALKIEKTIQDNSDVLSFEDRGRYYRNTFEIFFDEPRLFSYSNFKKFADEIPVDYIDLSTEKDLDEDIITDNSGGEE